MSTQRKQKKRVRYAVIGLGHIAQAAVLPAFAHAENSELVAIASDDPEKRREIGEQYDLEIAVDYDDLDDLLARGEIDAAYIALPNHLHCEYAVRLARAGVHVLCEKPLAVTAEECERMIEAAAGAGVKLMTAYRLHFEKANLKAVEIVRSGQLGAPRLFSSVFTMQVKPGNVRLDRESGGGTLYDIGIYCINSARYLFGAEPDAVQAWSVRGDDERFEEVDEATSAVMHFSNARLAAFTCGFGAAGVGRYQIVGTQGDLQVDPAFTYDGALRHVLTIGEKSRTQRFAPRDHFAPQLLHFSKCILKNLTPEPSGEEGLADVRIIEALYESAEKGKRIELPPYFRSQRPTKEQETYRPKMRQPVLVNVASPRD